MSAAAAIVTLDDYLRMSFDGPDAEYVDGQIVERAMPNLPHSLAQQALAGAFDPLRKSQGIVAGPEMRVRIGENTIRIPDYCVFRSRPSEDVPTEPPLLVVEVLSPSDSHSALVSKLDDYRAWGAEHIWVIDPQLKRLSVYRDGSFIQVQQIEPPELEVTLTPTDLFG